jgi:uncharacterized protein (TIGR02145 family)
MLTSYLRKSDTSAMLSNRFERDTASLSSRINLKLSSVDTTNMLSSYLRKSDTSAMLSNRFERDTASLSTRIDLKLSSVDTTNMLTSYLRKSDTSAMLSNRFARDTVSLSSRIDQKLSSADTSSLSRRIDSLRPLSSGDLVYGGTNGIPTRLSNAENGKVLTLTNGFPSWVSNNGATTVGPISATATSTGAYIASNTLYLAPADADNAGIVSTETQTFAGAKTFISDLNVNGITVGRGAGSDNGSNTAIGKYVLQNNTTGNNNTANGFAALSFNTTGYYNTANGAGALYNNTEGGSNTASGYISLVNNTTGYYNTANGAEALVSNTTGIQNTATGRQALLFNTTGNNNTAIGYLALVSNTTGNNNTAIGDSADVARHNLENATAIGSGAKVNRSNQIMLGNLAIDTVFTSGKLKLGTITYPNTAGTNGYVLTTDGSGTASWVSNSGGTTDTSLLNLESRFETKLNKTDTTSLSNRIDAKLSKTDTASLSDRINAKLNSTVFPYYPGLQKGHIMYWNGSYWVNLNPGTAGQVLTMSSAAEPVPVWSTVATTSVPAFSPCGATISDIDGNIYNTVLIGAQCWTKENLRVRRYNNGTAIQFDATGGSGGSSSTWQNLTIGAHTIYAHDSVANPSNLTKYGYLYNWYAAKGISTTGTILANDTLNICPSGWHVPTDAEWTTLTTELGGESVAGGKMKSIGTYYWSSQSFDTDNSSGFSALPGGFRLTDGSFNNLRNSAAFWRSTEIDANSAWSSRLDYNSINVSRESYQKSRGACIRCIKD